MSLSLVPGREPLNLWNFLNASSVCYSSWASWTKTEFMFTRWLRIGASHARKTNRVGALNHMISAQSLEEGRGLEIEFNVWPVIELIILCIMKPQYKLWPPRLRWASWLVIYIYVPGGWCALGTLKLGILDSPSILWCYHVPRWFPPIFRIHVISSFFSRPIWFVSFSPSYLLVLLRKFSKTFTSFQLFLFHHKGSSFYHSKLELEVVKRTPLMIKIMNTACVPLHLWVCLPWTISGNAYLAESPCLHCDFQI